MFTPGIPNIYVFCFDEIFFIYFIGIMPGGAIPIYPAVRLPLSVRENV